MIQVCDIVEYGLDGFGKRPETWRVTHHLKRVEDKLDEELSKEQEIGSRITLEICFEFRENERQSRRKRKLPAKRRYRLIYCKPEEATHVSLVGISGTIAPLNECKFIRTVPWSEEKIASERANAISDFWLSNKFPADWYWE